MKAITATEGLGRLCRKNAIAIYVLNNFEVPASTSFFEDSAGGVLVARRQFVAPAYRLNVSTFL